MEVKLSSEQHELISSVRDILARHRSKVAAPGPSDCDMDSLRKLDAAGYLDIMVSGGSAIDAVLVVETVAAVAPGTPVSGRILVGPLMTDQALPSPIALVDRPSGAVARYAPQAQAFLIHAGDVALLATRDGVELEQLTSRWGYPVARVRVVDGQSNGGSLGPGTGPRLLVAWRIALAAEAGGLMEAATLHATRHATERHQFGKPIGTYQAIQHRLARAFALSQGVKWLARRAAWDCDPMAAAAAACYASEGMREVVSTAHQVCGAIGITDEFHLTSYTARMAMLQTELGGASAHARSLAHLRWDSRMPAGQTARSAAS
jgi:hypothetical protein